MSSHSYRTSRSTTRRDFLAATVGLAALASGCGAPQGEAGPTHGPLEKTQLTIGVLPIIDIAGFLIAHDRGWFKEAGLDLDIQEIQGGAQATPLLKKGELDITWGNWVSYFESQSSGEIDLALITDGFQADENMFLTLAMPNSGIRNPVDLRGKQIAVNTKKNIVELNLTTTLKSYGVVRDEITLVEIPFPDMPQALANGEVDAAVILEPFLSQANKLGAQTVLDVASGPTQDIPVAGFASTREFAEKNPNTAAVFQRVMREGQDAAESDRTAVEQVLPKYTKTDPQTASLVRLGTFPRTLDATRLERVASLMKTQHMLPPDFEVEPMIFRASPSK